MFKTYAGISAQAGGGGPVSRVASPSAGSGPGGWEPSVLFLVGLTAAEIFIVAVLSRHLFGGS